MTSRADNAIIIPRDEAIERASDATYMPRARDRHALPPSLIYAAEAARRDGANDGEATDRQRCISLMSSPRSAPEVALGLQMPGDSRPASPGVETTERQNSDTLAGESIEVSRIEVLDTEHEPCDQAGSDRKSSHTSGRRASKSSKFFRRVSGACERFFRPRQDSAGYVALVDQPDLTSKLGENWSTEAVMNLDPSADYAAIAGTSVDDRGRVML